MSNRHQPTARKSSDHFFRLKPLVAGVRVVVAGGFVIGAGVSPVKAELPVAMQGLASLPIPLPVPSANVALDATPRDIIDKANHGRAKAMVDGKVMTIQQLTDKATADWNSFNIDKGYSVNVKQLSSTSVLLNNIHQQDASRILGSLTANGQIYLYNQNGFVFGKDSVVNANSLVASTLNISDEALNRGITKVLDEKGKAAFGDRPDANDATTAVNKASSITFEKGLKTDADGNLIDKNGQKILDKFDRPIPVEQGFITNKTGQLIGVDGQVVLDKLGNPIVPVPVQARIHADKDGRIIIVAPTIENQGSLSADEHGQIILAASQDKVYLHETAKGSDFAGLLVEVNTGGKVENMGNILARQGNITMAGFAVNQSGRVSATTSVNVNGSIRLVAQELGLAADKDPDPGLITADKIKTTRTIDNHDGLKTKSELTFDSGSVTQIVADNKELTEIDGLADKKEPTEIDGKLQPKSYLQAHAHTVALKSHSAIVVPGGKVDITATDKLVPNDDVPTQGTSGRIYVDKGAVIDVSGYQGVEVAMERNVGEISVQSYELRDAPLQKTGVLKGETVRVDLRKDTKIVDASGAQARVARTVKERLSEGGEINLISSGDVIINDGAKVNIAGGSVDYKDGYISTTKLLTDYGRIVDISAADPNEHYAAVYGVVKEVHKKWGVESVWDFGQGQFEKGYREGKAAGSINIKAPYLAWNGELSAGSDTGRYQRLPGDRPDGGSFVFDSTAFVNALQDVRFQTEKADFAIAQGQPFPKTDNNKPQALVLSTDLTNRSGVQDVIVKTRGQATVAADAEVRMADGGKFTVEAAGIDVQGEIHAVGGAWKLDKDGNEVSTGGSINLTIANSIGDVNLGAASVLDVSGRWVNDLQQSSSVTPLDPLYLDGGSINVRSVGDVFVRAGAKLSADGGARLAQNGKLTAGKGGKIALAAVGNGVASTVHLDGEVSAASLSKGGTLTLNSGEIILGAGVPKTADPLTLAVVNGQFAFDPESSFGAINLVGNFEGVTVGSDVKLDLKTKNLVLDGNLRQKATTSSIRDFAHAELLPEHLRQPFRLSLTGKTDVTLATGSAIVTDKESTVNLESSLGGIYIDGLIKTPAGKINLSILPQAGSEYDPSQSIRLGEHAQLLAQGTTRMNPLDALGRRTGEVLDGGQVTFDLKRGYLIAEQGSLIDVSGTHGVLDLPKVGSTASFAPVDVASNAGSIGMMAVEGAVLDGTLRGQAGSDTMRAGRFSLELYSKSVRLPPDFPARPFPNNPLLIHVKENQQPLMAADVGFGDDIPDRFNGQAVVSADALEAGGFSDVRLKTPDEIRFEGNVDLTTSARLELDAAKIAWVGTNGATSGAVNLNTALLRMGSSQQREVNGLPVAGAGQFNANAQWIELFGATQWDNFKRIDLNSIHDLRTVGNRSGAEREFLGAMVAAADLNLHASQIYPTTLSKFTFAVKNNPNGQINISGTNTDKSPLSAAGELSFEAPVINQSGVLKAPLGTINLKAGQKLTLAENSLTTVSAKDQMIPFGVTVGGLDWLYPLDTVRNLMFNTPPEKKLVLKAPEVILAKGSTVDISGGGDLYSYEFQAGSGGSYDYLQPRSGSNEGGFAVIPNLGSDLAPYDHYESTGSGSADFAGIELGSKVYLSGGGGLAAGEYTLLPAHYALLPGAFLVTPQAKTQDQTLTTHTKSGLAVVAGYQTVAGSGTRDARWSGFRIENGADVRLRSKYEGNTANAFYAAKALKNETSAPELPNDGGHISIAAQNKLVLDSTFLVDAANGGRGSRMDIAANKIKVVNQLSAAPAVGTLELLADDLSALKIDSLMLGGARNRNKTTGATDVDVTAQQVIFSADSKLHVSDMIAAATELVEVRGGAELVASGQVNSGDTVLNVNGDGVLLRVSGDKQVVLNRTNTPGNKGELKLAAGSKLSASESMVLDASKSTQLSGDIDMRGGSLNLGANTINLGEVDNLSGNALNLSNSKLQNFSVEELVLTSRGSIGIYGNLGLVDGNGQAVIGDDGLQKAVQFDSLVINAAGFSGFGQGGQSARLQANNLKLENLSATAYKTITDTTSNVLTLANTQGLQVGDYLVGAGFAAHTTITAISGDRVTLSAAPTAPIASGAIVTDAGHGNGQGSLELLATNVTQGAGNFGINGFKAVNLSNQNGFTADGASVLSVVSDLNLSSDYLTATGGSSFKINADGHTLNVSGNGRTVGAVPFGFGGAMEFIADKIDFNTKALLPSGDFDLHALTGDVNLGSQASLDLAGRKVIFADKVEYTPGGNFKAVADHGQVILAAGSLVDMSSGGGNAEGGKLTLETPEQSVVLKGQLQAAAGSAVIDVARFDATTGFDVLMKALYDAGANQSIYFRTRQADILQAADSTINAQTVSLVADRGAIDLEGEIHADANAEGGSIRLYAGDGITLKNGSELTAKGAKGGEVLLSSVDSDNDNVSGIDLQAGSLIDVKGSTAEKNGEVSLRALRNGSSIKIEPVAGTVAGAKKFYAEGVRKYTDDDGFITSTEIATIKADTNVYMTAANMKGVTNSLGNGIRLWAGVEVNYSGDLALTDTWDFADWRYNEGTGLSDMPGHLVVRAGGTFTVNESLSDGFKDGMLIGAAGTYETPVSGVLMRGDSWSYGLTAGADLTSADPTAISAKKDLVIGSNVKVRSGTGDIQLVAGGDIKFIDQTSTVYNAGRPTDVNPNGTLAVNMVVGALPYLDYPVEGGNLLIKAGKDIVGAVNDSRSVDAWLYRQGTGLRQEDSYLLTVASDLISLKDDAAALAAYKDTLPAQVKALIHDDIKIDTFAYSEPTTWGVILNDNSFQQNVGSFGGGKVEISAAGNIRDLSVIMPTTGKQTGQPIADGENVNTVGTGFLTNQVDVQGGGEMHVRAGKDIAGGIYYLGQGRGTMVADGAIKGGSQFTAGPQLLMGDTQLELQAKKDLSLTGVSDPMILGTTSTNFFSYGDASKLVAKSTSGDVHLGADPSSFATIRGIDDERAALAAVYPASLLATAFGGSVILDDAITLFPSAKGELNLLADKDISSKGVEAKKLGMSDADRALLPTALSPSASNALKDVVERIFPEDLAPKSHAETPVHVGDREPARLVTRHGDIKNIQFNLAKKALVHTGRDFSNVQLSIEHANLDDTSLLDVGRDLFYTSDRSADGALNGNTGKIKVSGAGELLVKTNRNFDLGASEGLSTVVLNTGPSDKGAGITVLSGLNGGNPDYAAFIGKYLEGSGLYAADFAKVSSLITDFMRQRSGNGELGEDVALAEFKSLRAEEYLAIAPKLNALILPVYMNEIRESGKASAGSGKLGNESGFAAIKTLFPGTQWSGDLSMIFSKIQTLDGGNINLLVPGGKVNAGLAVSVEDRDASELGIVAKGEGDVNAVINGDFLVNQSRVFSLSGDDITIWSSNGNIDAGSGAKSVIGVPPAEWSYPKGNLKFKFPPIVSGSGIRTAAGSPTAKAGDVYLFAPKGVIDAGEAGIGGNNVFLVATAVIGANNIQVGGVGTGVPVASTGSVAAGLTGTSNMTAGVSQMAESSVSAGPDNDKSAMKNAILGMLSVEVLGFGE
ncbi:MAG: filamentous hemagglutinin family protein [Methylococcaceae bacterium]|nr:filamentous hemagglutinin family protein [Methylococcaceae bacterium]